MGNDITLHIIRFNEHALEFLRVAQPAFAKVVTPWGHDTMKLAAAKRLSPNTQWICRLYRDEQPLDRPAYKAGLHGGLLNPYWDFYDIFESYNEPPPYGIEDWKRINEFEYHFAQIAHEKGKKNVAFNWSNGQPPYGAWQHCQDAIREADYIGIHSYDWPFLSTSDFALRHRGIPGMGKPIILTEFGFTNAVFGGPDVGYYTWDIHPWAAREYKCIQELAWFADRLQEDPYVLAACYFTTGRLPGDAWGTHDWTPKIYRAMAGYTPQTEPGEEEEMKSPIRVLGHGTMELEEYLRGVVRHEMPHDAPIEALKAQAVAARCYAMSAIKSPRHAPDADVCDGTHCQVWAPRHYVTSDAAVKATEGIVATHSGEVINAFYFGHCDGRTRNSEDVWVQALPYCRSVPCVCGWDKMYGHGVGMCQRGAMEMAHRGDSYKEILRHYYRGCKVDGEKAPEEPDYIQKALLDIAQAKAKIEGIDYLKKQATENLESAEENLLKERR